MKLDIDFARKIGRIKPMHAVGQPPFIWMSDQYMHYLTEAHIPYSRLHDVGGIFGGAMFVDIPNVFRNFDADENAEASYDFAFTDELMKALDKAKCKPIYRLGVTIENYANIKAYHIYPPKDYEKWARICEHIVRHYNEGWANGFHFGVEYWEIWNEPEDGPNNEMWLGTDVEYYRLYDVTAKHLKKCFGSSIKVGGYASCNLEGILQNPERFGLKGIEPREKNHRYYFLEYAEKFFNYIREKGSPIDFFSWHSYASIEDICLIAEGIQGLLKLYEYDGLETMLNEWNNAYQTEYRGTAYASANAAAMMLAMQGRPTDMLCYYDARIDVSSFGGMFNPMNCTPLPLYYVFKAFGELYELKNEVFCRVDGGDTLFVRAAVNDEGNKKAVMIANIGEECEINPDLDGFSVYMVDEKHHLDRVKTVGDKLTVGKNEVVLLANY